MKWKLIVPALLVTLIAASASAQQITPKLSQRQQVQRARVKDGIQNGELNRRETARLSRQQRSIKRSKHRAKADGVVTRQERAVIHKRQNQANRSIRRKKNN